MSGRKEDEDKLGGAIRTMGLVSMLTQAALTFVVGSFGGLYLGRYLDRRFGTEPLFLLVLGFGGFGAGIFTVILALQRYEKSRGSKQ